jgi:hypothetical protein
MPRKRTLEEIAAHREKVRRGIRCRPKCGTHLKRLVSYFGIKPINESKKKSCGCNTHAALMDRRGAEWCRQNIEEIVDWMEVEAKERGMFFLRFPAKLFVQKAITNALAESAFLESQYEHR